MVSYHLRLPNKRWPRILMVFAVAVAIILGSSVYLVRHSYVNNLKPVSSSQQLKEVSIPLDSSMHQIAKILSDAKVIRSTWAFEWYVRNQNVSDKLIAGTYSFRPSQSVQEIVAILTEGKISSKLFTILPAQRLDQIEQAMINAGFKPGDVKHALDPSLYAGHPALVDKPASASLEGYLYPESFARISSTKPETIIRQSLDEMQKHLTPDLRASIVAQGLTMHQGIILASIVEKEVSKPEDRPIVAQVFLKRLKQGMPLGSDVTAYYGAIVAGKEPSLTYDSAYNTHLHPGLPAGPISNVSEASLEAVAKPASTDYLFFVSGDDGITHFSNTLEEHQALTEQYCKKLCSKSN